MDIKPDPTMSKVEPVESHPHSTVGEVYDIAKDDHRSGHGGEDIAAELADKLQGQGGFTEKEVRRLRWKLDLRIIPLIFLNVVLPAMDKVSNGTAALYGLQTDLHLEGNQYAWIGSIFYVSSPFPYCADISV